jgi:hypothetical protein
MINRRKRKSILISLSIIVLLSSIALIIIIVNNNAPKYVNFNTDGGSIIVSVPINKVDAITRPTDPIKTGYDFKGWYTRQRLYKSI